MTGEAETELLERAERLLAAAGVELPRGGSSVAELRLGDIVVFRPMNELGDLYVFRDGRVVVSVLDGERLPGKGTEDFDYVLAAFRQEMILDDLADV